ncbi:MAG: RsmD family RNA methyltransferase [Corynebacterium sp.]|uniref:RsmD family RNA methyltransferase n=1 Tax=unclassified Corynebacterium TaxID=2624378 RepID=UPI00264861C5|nr:RsmD family RNA methyltransferase [Corynebacterium sp.]MDN5582330.1 RsmD family RNA methyltransferase [Corynebacterium sp.]MDN5718737.1 RsmD family RNA methyltransferase [Corynebacterium sp.]MDN6258728.1 RsmD family RNA methyltransferase [Corynebacterium sp.]MDN6324065.1 RsmD family RNA methyltransferase [Corynebacterium sp.]MDN6387374.1 RsmD family RNA methyltransferase [Corynebacterium sp.]
MTRIISGTARGRKIKVPADVTRPTADRAREGLFSSLQVRFGFEGEVVLDLFAGSGALGLEAGSRGAAEVTLVDDNHQACETIRANAATVGHPNVHVVEAKASSFLGTAPHNRFTMVLADPPYDLSDEAVDEMVAALVPTLMRDAVVVIERHVASAEVSWPEGFEKTNQKLKKRTYGIARMDMAIWRGDGE